MSQTNFVFNSETRALVYGLIIGVVIFIAGFIMAMITRGGPAGV